jgi:hypothetical protein
MERRVKAGQIAEGGQRFRHIGVMIYKMVGYPGRVEMAAKTIQNLAHVDCVRLARAGWPAAACWNFPAKVNSHGDSLETNGGMEDWRIGKISTLQPSNLPSINQ